MNGDSNKELSLDNEIKKCPFCAETIKFEAIKCRYCGTDLDPIEVAKEVEFRRIQLISEHEKMRHRYVSQKNKAGNAFCHGCRKVDSFSRLYYCKETDSYLHENCIPDEVSKITHEYHEPLIVGQGGNNVFNRKESNQDYGESSTRFEQVNKKLASREFRFIASIIDYGIGIVSLIPGALIGYAFSESENVMIICATLTFLGMGLKQLILITRNGQSIGKKTVGIHIVSIDGESNPGFLRVWLLRQFVPFLIICIPWLWFGMIGVSMLILSIDCFFIFGKDRQCIHDLIAQTKVLEA